MFDKNTYIRRREKLKRKIKKGVILLPGNNFCPMNYTGNNYRFRQDSSFLYFFGLDSPGLIALIDVDNDKEILFGDDATMNDIIWMGDKVLLEEQAGKAGINSVSPYNGIADKLREAIAKSCTIHYLPPYRSENMIELNKLLDVPIDKQKEQASIDLIKAIVELRSVKEPQEIAELEKAIDTAYLMHTTAMKMAKPGVYEREIAGVIEGIALSAGVMTSFPVILTKNGEILHNHEHCNKLEDGDLMLVDAGCESPLHYATDHTRTTPVGGKFTPVQKEIYQIVLNAQIKAMRSIKPGVANFVIHRKACETIVLGLKDMGIMKGNVHEAVEQGAHTLFMPHGIGHMLGLDAHDMGNLDENIVGYDNETKEAKASKSSKLRLGKKLKENYVITVEPGIYFIPQLINQWENDNKLAGFINYKKVKSSFIDFGGIRIEDDILVTSNGYKVLGKPIPKSVEDIENVMNNM